jgi:hypothetical protein
MSDSLWGLDQLAELLGPWTIAGGPDPDYDDTVRIVHHALLTDPSLLTCFRRRFPERGEVGYDEMVRCLAYVWDCPHDGAANVTGYRCAKCERTRAVATRLRDDGSPNSPRFR